MKKMILSLILSVSAIAAQAMSYEQAREEARFLTDKMAYELNLNDQQYNDCFEINLDYLLSVQTADDIVYGDYLAYRNADLRHILFDWQWTLFSAADYFLNPVRWLSGAWYFPVYHHYATGFFYYDRPRVFWSYRGGHGRFYFSGGFYASHRPRHWNGGFRGHDRGPIVHRGGHPGGSIHHGGHPGGPIHPGGGRSNQGHVGGGRPGDGHVGGRGDNGRAGRGDNGRSSYQHESSTRTTVHAGGRSQGGSISRGSGSMGRSSGGSRVGSMGHVGGMSRSSGVSHGGGMSRGGGGMSHGGSSRGGSHGGSHGGGSHGRR